MLGSNRPMLKKTQRLNRAAFSSYFATGSRTHSSYLTIITAPAPHFLCAAVVGKKVAKQATTRNTVRRRIYGLIEKRLAETSHVGVVIVIAKPAIASLSRADFLVKVGKEIGRVIN